MCLKYLKVFSINNEAFNFLGKHFWTESIRTSMYSFVESNSLILLFSRRSSHPQRNCSIEYLFWNVGKKSQGDPRWIPVWLKLKTTSLLGSILRIFFSEFHQTFQCSCFSEHLRLVFYSALFLQKYVQPSSSEIATAN